MGWLEDFVQDARFGGRLLARDPGFTLPAVAMLAVGTGLAAAMFTVYDAVLRRPLPVREQERVVVLWGEAEGSIRQLPLAYEHFERFREEPRALEAIGGVLTPRGWPHAVRLGEDVLTLNLAAVTGNFFDVLGTHAVLGRLLRPADDLEGVPRLAVISHAFWIDRFGGDPAVLGRTITLHDRGITYRIVGVVPRGLDYPAGADFWIPLRPFSRLEVVPIGRLAAGATAAQAAAELRASFQRDGPSAWRDVRALASALPHVVTGDFRPAIGVLSAATLLLVLLGCFNLSNLLLARASGRTHEIAIRSALGAGRARLLRQLFTESAILALAGGAAGVLLGRALVSTVVALAPPELPRLDEIRVATIPLWWASVVSIAAPPVFGLIPALVAFRAGPSLLGQRSGSDTLTLQRLQNALVVVQISAAIVLMCAAGLLGRSLLHLQRVELGFGTQGVALIELSWPEGKFDTPAKVSRLFEAMLPRLEALPGVTSVAPMHLVPFEGASGGIDGRFVADRGPHTELRTAPTLSIEVVGPKYFATLGIPLLRGRPFADVDRGDAPRVVIVSESVARLFWPGGEALGERLSMGEPGQPEDWWTVIGIVPETRYRDIRKPTPTVYVPPGQFLPVRRLVIRATGDAAAAVPAIRDAAQELDPDVLVAGAQTMGERIAHELAQPRLNALLLGVFALGALLLAGVGVYAVQAQLVRRRTRELAIRLAVGASPVQVSALVIRRSLLLAALGAAVGLPAAAVGARTLRALLFEISPADPPTLAGVALLMVAVALGASCLPARRAARADPAALLRQD